MENGERKLVDDVLDETKKEVECLGLTFKDEDVYKRQLQGDGVADSPPRQH